MVHTFMQLRMEFSITEPISQLLSMTVHSLAYFRLENRVCQKNALYLKTLIFPQPIYDQYD